MVIRRHSHGVGAPSPHAAVRHEDAAYFEDWSIWDDEAGPWIIPVIATRELAVRPISTEERTALAHLGGRCLRWHRYDTSLYRDWRIPAARWAELKALLPELQRARQRAIASVRARRQRESLPPKAREVLRPALPVTAAQYAYLAGLHQRLGRSMPPTEIKLTRGEASALIKQLLKDLR